DRRRARSSGASGSCRSCTRRRPPEATRCGSAARGAHMSVWKSKRSRAIAYWATTLLGPASFVVGGAVFLTQGGQQGATRARPRDTAYLLYILGLWKWLGAVAVVVPALPLLKEWAYAGFFFELTGAAAS